MVNKSDDRDPGRSTVSNATKEQSAMIFIDNKYTATYYKIVERAKQRNHTKQRYDGYQTHHIIPQCFGGTNDPTNLVVLSYKEHRVCHRLLINMTERDKKYRMMYAYKLFNKNYDISWVPNIREYKPESYTKMVQTRKSKGSYKTGKDNVFADTSIIEQVKKRMMENNPMTRPEQRLRMSLNNNNPLCKPIEVNGVQFPSIGKAAEFYNTTPYLFRKRYNYRVCDV
jgi:hypothetical protein